MTTADADIALCRRYAELYRMRGLQPLPSRADDKRPMVRFAEFWEARVPDDLFERFATPNLQVMTGRHWRLLVIDLDGPEAIRQWRRMGRCPRTWVTHSGGDGEHVWFRLPAGYPRPLPKAVLWRPDPSQPRTKGEPAIDRLCDRSLVMAPPSIHPRTGQRYRFRPYCSPKHVGEPAPCPAWVLALRPLDVRPVPADPRLSKILPRRDRPTPPPGSARRYDRRAVLEAIPDKIGLARSWGVRFDRDTGRAWVPCRAIDREDHHPSAAVNRDTGAYCDLGSGLRLSLFDLAVALGVYRDFHEAVAALGESYHAA